MLKIVIQVCKIHTGHHLGLKFAHGILLLRSICSRNFVVMPNMDPQVPQESGSQYFRTRYESPPKSLGRCGKANRSNSKSCFLFILFFFCIILTELVNLNRNFHIITVLVTLQANYIL